MSTTAAPSLFDGVPTPDILTSCGTTTSLVLSAVCLVALVVSFCGYRLYRAAIILLAFVLAAAVEGYVGAGWITQNLEEEVVAKEIIVAASCILWGLMGAWVCWRAAEKLQRFLGFALGVVLGAVAVWALLQVTREPLTSAIGEGFAGWEQYAAFTLVVPVSLAVGYASRNAVKALLMLTTAVLGAVMAVCSISAVLMCSNINLDVPGKDVVQLGAMVAIAALGFVTQLYTQPEQAGKKREAAAAGAAGFV